MDTTQPAAFQPAALHADHAEAAAESDQAARPEAPTAAPTRVWDSPLFWLGAMGLLSLLAPYVPITSRAGALIGIVVSTGLYVWFVVRLASTTARLFNAPASTARARPLWQVLAWCALAVALWATTEFVTKPILQSLMAPLGEAAPESLRLLGLANFTLRPLFLVAGATCGGVALSRLVRYPNMLGPLAGVAALIDIWGVLLGGIVIKLLTSPTSAPLAAKAMAPLPTLGAATGAGGGEGLSIASVGTGDFLFLGLFLGVLWAHRMEVRRVERLITPLVTLALLAIALGLVGHLPGLLFIGLGAALPNLKYLRYTREENFALLYAAILVAFLTAGLYFAISSQLEEAKPGQDGARPGLRGSS